MSWFSSRAIDAMTAARKRDVCRGVTSGIHAFADENNTGHVACLHCGQPRGSATGIVIHPPIQVAPQPAPRSTMTMPRSQEPEVVTIARELAKLKAKRERKAAEVAEIDKAISEAANKLQVFAAVGDAAGVE
jgi:hypothetical protein